MTSISAAILAGGKGRRLAAQKGLLQIGGEAIIARQLKLLKSIFTKVIIIANNKEPYHGMEADIFGDIILDKGPLGGLYSAIKYSQSDYTFIAACDMPYLNTALIRYMLDNLGGYDVVVPEFNQRRQPLFAFYSNKCLAAIEKQIESNNLKVSDFFSSLKTRVIGHVEVVKFDINGLSFNNVNTREDYERIKNAAG
ncbi:MAG: hypothetical protein COV72_04445 [Candidatus Omnitrophica bacterium CG11_big_fil_rev_8_21_14_0_20_42_13]|uniref:Probable molybdenum cofactor guanylyltransferase n=1 Tax=Candidatus Ghiorseimicrobium undicola TaxID=1974746 RepID=A0A2H0LXM0_9BACT|nr:MAG: hypothetical protein COV72_04445 [Candidatus Omnitrophica bacterium CG11_big_fil_rev_8_21_14_0_20_42_13]